MLLNRLEKALMNNPARALVQRYFEAGRLADLGDRLDGGRTLEVGCGRGIGTRLLLDRFGADTVDAFDLDPHMIELARGQLAGHADRVRLWVGDVTRIAAADDTYDAAFDFAIIHHVPAWREALGEIYRVLKPGARFYAEEVLASFIRHPIWRRVLDHPMEDRFDRAEFADGLREAGFRVVASSDLWGQFAWFVADKPARQ